MQVNLLNYNVKGENLQNNQTKSTYKLKNIYQQDVFERINKTNFTGNPKIFLFDDVAKYIKNGDVDFIKRLSDPHIINKDLKSLLHISAEEKQIEISRNLLDSGLNINQKDKLGRTPFAIACSKKDKNLINLFLDYRPNVNTQDELGNTPLHNAISAPQILEILLDKGANPYIKNSIGLPVLHEAAVNLDILEFLLKKGVSPDSINNEEQTLLHKASMEENKNLADILFKHGAERNFRDKNGKTPLFYVKNKNILTFLLGKGINPNIVDNQGRTIVHEFVMKNDPNCLYEALEFFADSDLLDKYNKTPLLYATNDIIRKILLEHGANPDIKTSMGNTLLHIAVQKGNEEVIKTLLNHNANVNIHDSQNKSPLYYAPNNKIRKILLEKGANPNEDLYLHWALKTNNKEFFNDLLLAKANTNIEDINGKTPIFYCKDKEDIIMLYKYNADLIHEDKNGNTPFHHFCLFGNTKLAAILAEIGAATERKNKYGDAPSDLYAKYKQYDCWIK